MVSATLAAGSDLQDEVAQIQWFHKIDFGNGLITPGIDYTSEKLAKIGLPADLRGQSVLDIGAWDGFFSFEAERRGARRVLAIDSFSWGGDGWASKAGFDLAHRILNSRVESRHLDVLDLSPAAVGKFDLVLFLGVLYHMQHPLLALERVASVATDQLILETHVDLLDCDRPAMAFYPGSELNRDPTNWCGPNPAMVEALLRTVGFREVKCHAGPFYFPPPTLRTQLRDLLRGTFRPAAQHRVLRSPRMVFHAWR
jgi:tRNA (mo5U34)-methyltransferase